jgi:hypothetical protein
LLPQIVTFVPPLAGPLEGVILVIVGTGTYVNTSAAEAVEVPFGSLTVTSTEPAASPGEVAVQLVAVEQLTSEAAVLPKSTVVAPEVVAKPAPVIVTEVPPESGPELGETPVTAGGEEEGAGPEGGGPEGGGPELFAVHWA